LTVAACTVAVCLLLGANAVQVADVIFQDGTSKAIRVENLTVGGTSYTAEFEVNSKPFETYGSFTGTYGVNNLGAATEAMQ